MSEVKRYNFAPRSDWSATEGEGLYFIPGPYEVLDGAFVSFKDYKQLSDYADHLAAFAKLPCLPKDLEILRDSNTAFAAQVHQLTKDKEGLDKLVVFYRSRLEAREADLKAIKEIIQ